MSVGRNGVGERCRSQWHQIWRTQNESDVNHDFRELVFSVLSFLKLKKKIAPRDDIKCCAKIIVANGLAMVCYGISRSVIPLLTER